jgi:hypothetical protein
MLTLVQKAAYIALEVATSIAVAAATYYVNEKLNGPNKTSKTRKHRAKRK